WLLFGWAGPGRLDHCPRSGGKGVDRYMQYRNTLARAADFPIYGAYQGTYGGENDMFIMKIDLQSLIDTPTSTTTPTPTTTSTPTPTTTDEFPLGLVEGGIVVGIIAVIAILLFVRKRAG
ncbi:MAG: hypothetical protein OEZ48_15155, partial [Candidatus Bathyarchaeota archaeon]|nr:hypothetical protein [Candidatus Bathyarchaeota archaeon]